MGHTCVRPQKLRWPRAPLSRNPSLTVVTSVSYSITFASLYKKLWCHRSVHCKTNHVFRFLCCGSLSLGFYDLRLIHGAGL